MISYLFVILSASGVTWLLRTALTRKQAADAQQELALLRQQRDALELERQNLLEEMGCLRARTETQVFEELSKKLAALWNRLIDSYGYSLDNFRIMTEEHSMMQRNIRELFVAGADLQDELRERSAALHPPEPAQTLNVPEDAETFFGALSKSQAKALERPLHPDRVATYHGQEARSLEWLMRYYHDASVAANKCWTEITNRNGRAS